MLIIDIFILIFVFIFAVYVSQIYDTFINAESQGILDPFVDDIPKTSRFMLKLPTYVSTIGVLIMILSYIGSRRRQEEVQVLGF